MYSTRISFGVLLILLRKYFSTYFTRSCRLSIFHIHVQLLKLLKLLTHQELHSVRNTNFQQMLFFLNVLSELSVQLTSRPSRYYLHSASNNQLDVFSVSTELVSSAVLVQQFGTASQNISEIHHYITMF